MSTHHEGTIQMMHLFNEAWSFVKKEEGINLKTEREKMPFRAEAKYTTRGKHKGEKVIMFYQKMRNMHEAILVVGGTVKTVIELGLVCIVKH